MEIENWKLKEKKLIIQFSHWKSVNQWFNIWKLENRKLRS